MNTGTLTVHLTPTDYAVAERHIAESLRRQGRWYWPLRAIGVAIGFLVVLGFIGLFTYEPRNAALGTHAVRNSALMLLAAGALVGVAALLHRNSVAGVLFKPGSRLLKPYSLSLGESGITVESTSGTASLPWSAVLEVELHGNHLFLFTQPNYAVVIPAHAFGGRSELEAFSANISALRAQHAV
jgi:hypothetical protein